jgi:glycosyltransferase involved in cell wall biosynthesis
MDRRAASLTDVVIAVSGRLRDYLERSVRVPRQQLVVIENGVDTDVFSPGDRAAARAAVGVPQHAFVVGSVGRLEPVKAYHRLIEAFATARNRVSGARPLALLIAGDGSERAVLEARARELGVADAVHLHGWSARPVDVYRALDVFALTSVSEGMSVSLLEAMSCGALPAVADVGANAEVLGPEFEGQVVPPGDVEGMARLMVAAASEPDRAVAIGRRARARVVARYGLASMLAAYERVYRGGGATL